MEKFNFLVRQARSYFETADHLAYVTYPMIREVKMLFIVVENLHKASMKLVGAVLHYERLYKRIMHVPLEFSDRLDIFAKVANRYKINYALVETMKELKDLVEKHNKSPMVFSRGDKFVIANDQFSLKTLDITLLKKYILDIRTVLTKVEAIKQ